MALETFDIESDAILGLKDRLGETFAQSVQAMLSVRGRVVVMGMGKSGHIGRKMAATLASTGTPALFVHSGEANHGDLGMIKGDDLLIVISNSGESDELLATLPVVKRLGATVIALTGKIDSTLARHADIVLDCGVHKEACPLNLAPTASSIAQLAMGDALAMALLDARVVIEIVVTLGDGEVRFLDAADHFIVELLLENGRMRHHRLGVSVFCFQVSDHVRVFLLTQPIIIVDARMVVDGQFLRLHCRDWGLVLLGHDSSLEQERERELELEYLLPLALALAVQVVGQGVLPRP